MHPLQCRAIASARLNNDRVDAAILARLLRAGLLPEARIAPPAIRQLRALLRHRARLVRLRTLLRNRIRAVLAGHGPAGRVPGRAGLAALQLPAVSREVIEDDLALTAALQPIIDRPGAEVRQHARSGPRVKVLVQLPGAGPIPRWSCWLRSATSPGSARRASWRPGPGSRLSRQSTTSRMRGEHRSGLACAPRPAQ
ncbi:MAG TPA: hypothetical protein DEH11_08540 [Actinobacteria bacterium]|nr:hypothetical protein [Actinomycetota bacterium]